MYLLGKRVAMSTLAGGMTAAMVVFNFFEVSRVHNHPELRETYALPFLWLQVWHGAGALSCRLRFSQGARVLLQILFVVDVLRSKVRPSGGQLALVAASSATFMAFWQFGQFPLLIQAFALYCAYVVDAVPADKVSEGAGCVGGSELYPYMMFAHAQLGVLYMSLLAGAALTMTSMFFNEMLVASLYVYFLVAAMCALHMPRSMHIVVRTAALAAMAVGLKVPIVCCRRAL